MNKFKYLNITNTKKIRYLSQNTKKNLYIIFLDEDIFKNLYLFIKVYIGKFLIYNSIKCLLN